MSTAHAVLTSAPFLGSRASELGLTRHRLQRLTEAGSVRRLLRGVYVRSDAADTTELRARAASLVLPEHCVVSDRTAAWIYGIDCRDHLSPADDALIEVVSTRGAATRREGIRGGSRDLRTTEITELFGCRVTTPLRTACDVACLHGHTRALAVLDQFCREYRLTSDDFTAVAARFSGRRGVKQLRRLAPYASPLAESPAESWTRAYLIEHDIGPVELQTHVWVPGWGDAYLDMSITDPMVAVEYDGEEFHSSLRDRRRDQERRAALTAMGWSITVVTKDDLRSDRRGVWVNKVERMLRLRRIAGPRVYSRGPDNYRGPRRPA